MAFIDKKDPVVLNIKITSKGRELLSKGSLNFKYFALGDSGIDYEFIRNASELAREAKPFNISSLKQLRPVDANPNIISFISRNYISGDTLGDNQYNEIASVPSITWEVENTIESIGFFSNDNNNFTFKVSPDYIKQPDLMMRIDETTNNHTRLLVAPTYGSTKEDPIIGDYLLVRWVNDDSSFDTTGYTITATNPAPILIYKVIDVSGSTTSEDLEVWVDRDFPVFNTEKYASVMVLYSNTSLNVEQQYSTDYASEALLTFLQNCQCDTIIYPFWKLSIIYTENIAGVSTTNIPYSEYNTNVYGGFVSYIQNHAPTYKKLGVIHYSNESPANVYAEKFLRNTPKLHLPTIMWHKSTGSTVGLTVTAIGNPKLITGTTTSLNTTYYDLADESGNIVGKVFNDLKIFVIEDQELLFAMSYKSNRSWTLPNFSVGSNDTIYLGCVECTGDIDFTVTVSDTTIYGGNDGSLIVSGITGLVKKIGDGTVFLRISGTTSGIVFAENINTEIVEINELFADTYDVTIIDLGAGHSGFEDIACIKTIPNIIISDPTPQFEIPKES